MNYKEIEVESMSGLQKHIIIDNGEGSFTSFPADNSNPNFIAFLQELEKESDPYFTQWVEAGNNPEDFWTQSDEMIEPSQPKEETQVIEEEKETPQEGES